MNKDRYQSTSARRALALLNSPPVNSESGLKIIGIKNKLTKKKSENPDETANKEPSHLDFHCLLMYVGILQSKLPDLILGPNRVEAANFVRFWMRLQFTYLQLHTWLCRIRYKVSVPVLFLSTSFVSRFVIG